MKTLTSGTIASFSYSVLYRGENFSEETIESKNEIGAKREASKYRQHGHTATLLLNGVAIAENEGTGRWIKL